MALVPPGVVTLMSAVPEPAGLVAVIWVALLTVKALAATVPNLTAVAAVRLVPVMTTDVPPAGKPLAGTNVLTEGDGLGDAQPPKAVLAPARELADESSA